ncbi:MAG: hypothetical protein JXO48_10000 [Deltaproteobacteria bacterium]|nr:hypothetical protein [Deltaproteobacteria bacterium]
MNSGLDSSKIAIIGPGRLGTAFAYKFARDGKKIQLYYHDAGLCREINATGLNPKHLTNDLSAIFGGIENVPRLGKNVQATHNLEQVIEENSFVMLAITMRGLPEILNYIKPILEKKKGATCLISPIKGLTSDEKTRGLVTPSQMIENHLFDLLHKHDLVCVGGPFFDIDLAAGKPVCVTVAGKRKITRLVRKKFFSVSRQELNSYYNVDTVGIEACGALKNIVANIKGIIDCLDLGNSMPGTLFARSGVEIRALSKILGGGFQAFHSQAGVGDMYVTLSSVASKNYRYGRYYYELFNGNPIETHRQALERIDGTPEGPDTMKNVHRFLEKKNMYSPLFHAAYRIFNEGGTREDIREQIIQACQFDKREKEYITTSSRVLYRLLPNLWYRRQKGILTRLGF